MLRNASAAPLWRRALVATAGAALVVTPLGLVQTAQAADAEAGEWTWSRTVLDTGVAQGYQMGVDKVNRKVYFTDAQARTDRREKVKTFNAAGEETGWFWQHSSTGGSAKVVEFDMAEKRWTRDMSYLNLTRIGKNAKKEGEAHSWDGLADSVTSQSSMRTHFSPNGIAIDGNTVYDGKVDPTIITTHVRQRGEQPDGTNKGNGGGIVIFRASQGAPTDADRLWEFDDTTPISDGSRRVAVNTKTHKAFITNMGTRNDTRRGYVTVIDLVTKKVEARVAIPKPVDTRAADGGVIGVAVDEATNTVYAGTISGGDLTKDQSKIFAIDANNLDTSDPKNKFLNASKVTELPALIPTNARPEFVEADKRLYVSSYDSGTISVIDADKASATYGQLLDQVVDGPTNSVEVDPERNLLFSAGLADKELKVYDTETLDEIVTIPTYSRANDIAVDPVTGEVWVGYFSFSGSVADKTEVFDLKAPVREASEAELSIAPTTFGKAGKATVVVTDAEGDAAKGAVTVTVNGTEVKATLKRGEATVSLPAALKAGKHVVTAAYAGNDTTASSSASGSLTVAKASVKVSAKVAAKATVKKAGKVKVSVKGAVAGTPATGKVTITLKKGKSTKKVAGSVKNNSVTVKLPKLKKGTWKATAKYAGASNYSGASAKVNVVVK